MKTTEVLHDSNFDRVNWDWQSAFEVLELVDRTSKRTEKIRLLQNNSNNRTLLWILKKVYDPFIKFGIKDKSLSEERFSSRIANGFDLSYQLNDLIGHLEENNTGSDYEKSIASTFLFLHTYDDLFFKWIYRILLKDLNMGVNTRTIVKVFGRDFVPLFQVQLCPQNIKYLPQHFFVEPKIDGVRCVATITNKSITLRSRNGHILEGYDDVISELRYFKEILVQKESQSFIFDGELQNANFDSTMDDMFRKSSNKKAVYTIFDKIPLDAFYQGEYKKPYEARRLELEGIFQRLEIHFELKSIKLINSIFTDKDMVDKLKSDFISKGYEGIIIKDATRNYEFKRSDAWQKMKLFHTKDFVIVDVEQGKPDGKYANTLGSVIVQTGKTRTKVSSGFSDEERDDIWNNPENYIGVTIEVQYQEDSRHNKLRIPTFKRFRYDK